MFSDINHAPSCPFPTFSNIIAFLFPIIPPLYLSLYLSLSCLQFSIPKRNDGNGHGNSPATGFAISTNQKLLKSWALSNHRGKGGEALGYIVGPSQWIFMGDLSRPWYPLVFFCCWICSYFAILRDAQNDVEWTTWHLQALKWFEPELQEIQALKLKPLHLIQYFCVIRFTTCNHNKMEM